MAYLGSKPANILTDVVITDGSITSSKLASSAVTYAKLDSNLQQSGMKNRIINGAMVIDQRNAGASVTPTTAIYTLDRWLTNLTQASKFSVQQNAGSVTPPTGFSNYLGATSLSSFSVASSDYFALLQNIEGFNTADLGWGTANAAPVTLSFWVRSSLTGTFGGSITNSALNRSYPFSYTISSANTWTQISVTIAGDTTGTWIGATNGVGIRVWFSLGAGSTYSGTAGSWSGSTLTSATGATSVVGTNGATFYITGVQLEKGTQDTSFEYRPYTTELQLCQRYYIVFGNEVADSLYNTGYITSSGSLSVPYVFPSKMRVAPTGTVVGTFTVSNVAQPTLPYISSQNVIVFNQGTVIGLGVSRNATTAAHLTFSAEL